ncbi:hypothetical protein H6P81_005180 [Aristolochia fimbriata]|uniref:Electron transporter n=1 Tax=Aristolochia fimbriata TaxID=158543 RepID=A0AAV7EWK9_ARIFI|nr:hypothetical protein H6P81_005180 [Aristolochia fimbriata]
MKLLRWALRAGLGPGSTTADIGPGSSQGALISSIQNLAEATIGRGGRGIGGMEAVGEGRGCPGFSQIASKHNRSKSASEKNLDSAGCGSSHFHGKYSNVRQDLRAMLNNHGSKSPLNRDSTKRKAGASSINRASLENDIEQLQMRLSEERSMRVMLERAIGRASSTLSPGHRHFSAQTKELIHEIELLEEEVANREQHILSLYRSIFDQCLSGAPSEQSSVVTSPAHTKHEARKHPSIISSSFCSSKKFPLQSFQALSSSKDNGKKSSLSYNVKVQGKPLVEKNSMPRSLKDHLYQGPSELSEELVRCMATIYCWVCKADSTKTIKVCSPLPSKVSTNVVLPQGNSADGLKWPCKSMTEVSWISTDKNQYHRASYAISSYRVLVEQLERVNANQMENNAKLAFWINVYNSLVMHAFLTYGVPHGSLRRVALFHKAAYNIGGHIVTASVIEHSILCCRAPRASRWVEAILSTAMRKKFGEERQLQNAGFVLNSEPLTCFALCSGAFSDPVLKVYTALNVIEELESARRDYLQANVVVKKTTKVFLPKILERYAKETSIGSDELLRWVSENVDKKLQEAITKCTDPKGKRKMSQIIEWIPYDTRFRYVFSKELAEKPWWI